MNSGPKLIIEIVEGRVTVNGPIQDKLLCYGLLEAARDAIKDFQPEKPGIQIAPAGLKLPPGPTPNGRLN